MSRLRAGGLKYIIRMAESDNKINEVLTAWKAVQSEAIVTGDEVLGRDDCKSSAWKAVRLWQWINFMTYGVVPSRHIIIVCLSEDYVPGYYRFAL